MSHSFNLRGSSLRELSGVLLPRRSPTNNVFTDSVRRAARKEAWYGDSMNPFRKISRAATVPTPGVDRDIEAAQGVEDETPLSNVQTEPMPRASNINDYNDTVEELKPHGQPAQDQVLERRGSEPQSGTTAVEKQSTHRMRRGAKFWQRNKDAAEGQDEDKPKKRPWYKGKILAHKEPFTVRNQLSRTILGSWVNILLLAAPAGIALNYAKVDGKAIFVVNFIAIIPLAGMLSFATEEIALHVGESLGGLLNATFGNAVELIVAIIALSKNEITVVQTSLIGSILSNLLLVLGMCFFFGGLRRPEQYFNQTVAQTAASLLALAVGSVIIPTCFDVFSSTDVTRAPEAKLAAISRGTSIILLVVYGGYLFFQLKTHAIAFNEQSQKVPMKPRKKALPQGAVSKVLAQAGGVGAGPGRAAVENRLSEDELINRSAHEEEEEEPEEPQLHIAVAWATLAGATAIIGLCAEFMVDGIAAVTEGGAVSVEFVGLILLPIVGNAAEHATAITVACKDKMDLAIGVAVGSSMQVALLLIPLMVVIGWIMGNDQMNLSFDGFQVTVLFVAVLVVNYLIMDGKSHYLEGMLLQCLYLIIAVCAYHYPQKDPKTGIAIPGT
ncbi:putative Ca2+-transport (H+ exchange) protein [Venustampulla echinocandica]|uniref:Putative Ca2+-transport (H+ exchange) protein n=1 Tax=Venustampulla echinocandica TaxID=2656787 RepID=A0A370TWK2_9HELO|nr:putative Ca2+-transport (H+ exchange) protein [Venustampulla echinocandica]RDL39905.1 putative Ca2+-transport (H+ exchange) protein [Venustampulla echinocandica]